MNKFVKAALTTALVMGGAMSVAQAGSNNGTVTFVGTIVDSPCSIKIGDEHQTVNLGDSLGTASLKAGLIQAVDFDIELVNCVFTTEKDIKYVFNASGDESSTHAGYLALMGATGEMAGSYIKLATAKGVEVKLGETQTQAIVMGAGTGAVGLQDQTLNFKAWVQGDTAAETIQTGEFSTLSSFQITYL